MFKSSMSYHRALSETNLLNTQTKTNNMGTNTSHHTRNSIDSDIYNEKLQLNSVIEIKKLKENVLLPSYKTSGSSGMDIKAFIEDVDKIVIEPGKTKLIPTGISIAMPECLEAQIRPRSGLALKNSISVLNTPGTIDSDYRGEIGIILINHGEEEYVVNNGDRIAQMVFCPVIKCELNIVEELSETVRGEGGFGSTGVSS